MTSWGALRPSETRRGEAVGAFPVPLVDVAEIAVTSPEDRALYMLTTTALGHVESYTRRWLQERDIVCVYDVPQDRPGISTPWHVAPAGDGWGFLRANERVLLVPGSPMQEVTEVEARTDSDAETYETVPAASYRVEYGEDGKEAEIIAKQASAWPLPATRVAAYRVSARVGYKYGELPSALYTAVALLASYLYESRGCDAREALHKSGAAGLAAPYRMRRII